ncbi:hypothetical protein JB92DRAFT_3106120 [Gautieria morchelliformis]|nr:hypothetical protein JB92DRAFT_3106120 [Gautieria morchelliformis]
MFTQLHPPPRPLLPYVISVRPSLHFSEQPSAARIIRQQAHHQNTIDIPTWHDGSSVAPSASRSNPFWCSYGQAFELFSVLTAKGSEGAPSPAKGLSLLRQPFRDTFPSIEIIPDEQPSALCWKGRANAQVAEVDKVLQLVVKQGYPEHVFLLGWKVYMGQPPPQQPPAQIPAPPGGPAPLPFTGQPHPFAGQPTPQQPLAQIPAPPGAPAPLPFVGQPHPFVGQPPLQQPLAQIPAPPGGPALSPTPPFGPPFPHFGVPLIGPPGPPGPPPPPAGGPWPQSGFPWNPYYPFPFAYPQAAPDGDSNAEKPDKFRLEGPAPEHLSTGPDSDRLQQAWPWQNNTFAPVPHLLRTFIASYIMVFDNKPQKFQQE